MAQSVSGSYETEEAKSAKSKPETYVAFMRESKTFASADYSAGTHDNTEFTGGKLQLQAGQSSGSWTSAVQDSEHFTPNVVIDKITWTETLNGGTVTVQLKSAATEAGAPSATAATYTSGTLDHTARYRYWQIVVSFTSTNSSPTVEDLVARHKALIPRNEYMSLGSVSCNLDIDFGSISAGGVSIALDNKSHQWEKRNSSSYIYEKAFYYEKLEIWAGFELADNTTEWLLQFLGEIETLNISSGQGSSYNADLSARDFLYRKLANTRIGRPTAAGNPNPYMAGKRYRVRCKETDAVNHVYSFYCQQTISSIDATYTRDSGSNKWATASPSSTDASAKTVTFASDPGADVAVDITVDSTDHPCDIITNIIENELVLDSDQYDSTVIATTKSRTSSLAVGVAFDNMTVLEAFKLLGEAMDAGIFIENGVLKPVSYYPAVDESFTFADGVHRSVQINDSVGQVQNTASLFYGDYEDDKTKYVELQLSDSVTAYGELTGKDFSFTYEDPVSITSSTAAEAILGHWLSRQDDQFEIITLALPMEILRVELLDVIALTAAKHSFSAQKTQVYGKTVSLADYSGQLILTRYPSTQWAFAQDAGATEDLYYAVDTPVPDNQIEYKSYAW